MKKRVVIGVAIMMMFSLSAMEEGDTTLDILDDIADISREETIDNFLFDHLDPQNFLDNTKRETLKQRLLELSEEQYQQVLSSVSLKRSPNENSKKEDSKKLVEVLYVLTDQLKETNVQMREQHELDEKEYRFKVRKWQWGVLTSIVTFLITNGGQLVGNIWQAAS